jgi:hypothetical protein
VSHAENPIAEKVKTMAHRNIAVRIAKSESLGMKSAPILRSGRDNIGAQCQRDAVTNNRFYRLRSRMVALGNDRVGNLDSRFC